MYKYLLISLLFLMAIACKDEPASLSGDAPVDIKDFVAAFKKTDLPYRLADTNFTKMADTTNISYTVFSQFVPDSVLTGIVNKKAKKFTIHPLGKIEKENELYLLANFTQNKKTTLFAFLLNKENKYLGSLKLLQQDNRDNYRHSVSITSEPTFIIGREKTNFNNETSYTRNGYAYNSGSGNFVELMSDSNEDLKRINEIINPIDTLPRKNKFSGDYAKDKRNTISIRDGANADKYAFFIHFEKSGGDCTGELKGTLMMRDARHGYFQESGDPCVIDFTFEGKTVIVKEQGNCGNHRGIKCFFDDSFTKKKETKTAKKNK